jgi:hypothetical protein
LLVATPRQDTDSYPWFTPSVEESRLSAFGIKISGGGIHQTKTMMLSEIKTLLSSWRPGESDPRNLVVETNILSKKTMSSRKLTFDRLNKLYGLAESPPVASVFLELARRDPYGMPLHCLIVCLARDPLLRDTAMAVLPSEVGDRVQWPVLADVFEHLYPSRFSPKTLKSLSQNCASSWTQSGHLEGSIRKLRRRVKPTPANAAFAALLASICGYGGPVLLSSSWMQVLDLSPDGALDLLRQAEAIGLARVRAAGDVVEIAVRQPMQTTLGVQGLV